MAGRPITVSGDKAERTDDARLRKDKIKKLMKSECKMLRNYFILWVDIVCFLKIPL